MSKKQSSKFTLGDLTPLQLGLILALVILIVPALLSLPYRFNWEFFDLSGKGEIGDALGGITAPFINAFAAILVFVAFKEQIKANKLIQEQQYFQHIEEQILRLEKDELGILNSMEELILNINNSKSNSFNYEDSKLYRYQVSYKHLGKVLYFSISILKTSELIRNLSSKKSKDLMEDKLTILYISMYLATVSRLRRNLKEIKEIGSSNKGLVLKLLTLMEDLETEFKES